MMKIRITMVMVLMIMSWKCLFSPFRNVFCLFTTFHIECKVNNMRRVQKLLISLLGHLSPSKVNLYSIIHDNDQNSEYGWFDLRSDFPPHLGTFYRLSSILFSHNCGNHSINRDGNDLCRTVSVEEFVKFWQVKQIGLNLSNLNFL